MKAYVLITATSPDLQEVQQHLKEKGVNTDRVAGTWDLVAVVEGASKTLAEVILQDIEDTHKESEV